MGPVDGVLEGAEDVAEDAVQVPLEPHRRQQRIRGGGRAPRRPARP